MFNYMESLVDQNKLSVEKYLEMKTAYTTAMAQCQGEIGIIGEDQKVSFGITWTYASWPQIREKSGPVLAKHHILCEQHAIKKDGAEEYTLITEISHACGYSKIYHTPVIGDFLNMNNKNKREQALQSAITYWKRNVYNMIFCIGTDEEDSDKKPRTIENKQKTEGQNLEEEVYGPEEDSETMLLTCPKCGRNLVEVQGKNGPFYGCPGYPQCKFILNKSSK